MTGRGASCFIDERRLVGELGWGERGEGESNWSGEKETLRTIAAGAVGVCLGGVGELGDDVVIGLVQSQPWPGRAGPNEHPRLIPARFFLSSFLSVEASMNESGVCIASARCITLLCPGWSAPPSELSVRESFTALSRAGAAPREAKCVGGRGCCSQTTSRDHNGERIPVPVE